MEAFEKGLALMEQEKEKCVACNEETPVNKNDHVDSRLYYVEGAGQLCKKCWNEIWNED